MQTHIHCLGSHCLDAPVLFGSVVTTTVLSPPSQWLATVKPTLPLQCFTVFSAVFLRDVNFCVCLFLADSAESGDVKFTTVDLNSSSSWFMPLDNDSPGNILAISSVLVFTSCDVLTLWPVKFTLTIAFTAFFGNKQVPVCMSNTKLGLAQRLHALKFIFHNNSLI